MLTDELQFTLTLSCGSNRFVIQGGAIKSVDLTVESYGFRGEIAFVLSDDKSHQGGFEDTLITEFLKPDLIKVSLDVAWRQAGKDVSPAEPLTLAGLVCEKRVTEGIYRYTKDLPILERYYWLRFADPAAVLWTQHFPTQLYTETSVKAIITEHAGAEITLTVEWTALDTAKPQFFLCLGEEEQCSFYDFVMWYADRYAGVWVYDYQAGQYKLRDNKNLGGSTYSLFGDDMTDSTVIYPEVPRYQRVVLNSFTGSATNQSITQEQAVTGIRRDSLMRTEIAQDVDSEVTRQKARTPIPAYEVELGLSRGDMKSLAPGGLFTIAAANRWSQTSALVGKTWRIWRLLLKAEAVQPTADTDSQRDVTAYEASLRVRAEQQSDLSVRLPAFHPPRYPGYMEGLVVSEQGEEEELTYQSYQDTETSLSGYKIKIPLWEDKQINVPFMPEQGAGKVYIPAFKGERVLVAMFMEQAYLSRLLVWREGATLPVDVQGERIYFGKSADSQTTLTHQYDSQNPVFQLSRKHQKDTSTIELKEGVLFIQVKEESSE